jgi:hypothetical protein
MHETMCVNCDEFVLIENKKEIKMSNKKNPKSIDSQNPPLKSKESTKQAAPL